MLAFARILGSAAAVISAVPLIVGVVRPRGRAWPEMALLGWIALMALLNVTTVVMSMSGRETIEFVNWALPWFLLAGMYALGSLLQSKTLRRGYHLSGIGFVALWIWQQTQPRTDYAYILGPSAWALLSLGAAGLMMTRFRSRELGSFRDFGVLIGLGVLVTYAPLATLEALSTGLAAINPELVMLLWTVRIGLMILGSLLFTLAFLWTLPPHSVSGSSASAS